MPNREYANARFYQESNVVHIDWKRAEARANNLDKNESRRL